MLWMLWLWKREFCWSFQRELLHLPFVLKEGACLGGNCDDVLANKDGGDPAVLEQDHIDSPDEDGDDVNGDQAEDRVEHHFLWGNVLPLHADLTEGHTRQDQEEYVAVEEHEPLCPDGQAGPVRLPQVGLDVQDIQQVKGHPEEASPQVLFLPKGPYVLHAVQGHQHQVEPGHTDREEQGQGFPGHCLQVLLVCFVILKDEIQLDLQHEDVEEPQDHGITPLGCLHLCPHPHCHVAQHNEEADVPHQHDDADTNLAGPLVLLHQVCIHEGHAGHDDDGGQTDMALVGRWQHHDEMSSPPSTTALGE